MELETGSLMLLLDSVEGHVCHSRIRGKKGKNRVQKTEFHFLIFVGSVLQLFNWEDNFGGDTWHHRETNRNWVRKHTGGERMKGLMPRRERLSPPPPGLV